MNHSPRAKPKQSNKKIKEYHHCRNLLYAKKCKLLSCKTAFKNEATHQKKFVMNLFLVNLQNMY
jgi:hypothetical protein